LSSFFIKIVTIEFFECTIQSLHIEILVFLSFDWTWIWTDGISTCSTSTYILHVYYSWIDLCGCTRVEVSTSSASKDIKGIICIVAQSWRKALPQPFINIIGWFYGTLSVKYGGLRPCKTVIAFQTLLFILNRILQIL